MIRKFIILLCLCCATLCAIVGVLSNRVDNIAEKHEVEAVVTKCEDFILEEHLTPTRILLTDFVPGKAFYKLDENQDDQLDQIIIPLFPNHLKRVNYGYKSAIVCFKSIDSKAEFKQLISDGKLDLDFFPSRQKLKRDAYSDLATKYKNMDIEHSPILHYGFETSNPLLGKISFRISAVAGVISLIIGFIAFISAFLTPKKKEPNLNSFMDQRPTENRAGLPQL
ncbi:MAG: hypothetical protein P8J27_11230 [Mariniblastus sp.]|nr:hypothetical protein [Mariniblastus sp.]